MSPCCQAKTATWVRSSRCNLLKILLTYPLERFLIKNFITYFPEEGVLQIAPQLWRALLHYEVKDVLTSADEQIHYYLARLKKRLC